MPEVWAQLGVDYANARGYEADEEEAYAFTDALVFGYALREVETTRADARPMPSDIAKRLRDAPTRAGDVLQAVVELAETELPDVRTLTGKTWSDFDYWAGQFNRLRSRGRKRERGGFAIPAQVDYEHGLLFGYALRCCSEVRGDDRLRHSECACSGSFPGVTRRTSTSPLLIDSALFLVLPALTERSAEPPHTQGPLAFRSSTFGLPLPDRGLVHRLRAASRCTSAVIPGAHAGWRQGLHRRTGSRSLGGGRWCDHVP
jgi:hypothetical protein